MKIIKEKRDRTAYLAYPLFVCQLPLGDTARLVYARLYSRAQLSVRKGWVDALGAYIYYPITALAKDCGKCEMTIKTALSDLQKAGLILRKRQGVGRANKIYVNIPQTDPCPPDEQFPVCHGDNPLSGKNQKEILDHRYTFCEGESL